MPYVDTEIHTSQYRLAQYIGKPVKIVYKYKYAGDEHLAGTVEEVQCVITGFIAQANTGAKGITAIRLDDRSVFYRINGILSVEHAYH